MFCIFMTVLLNLTQHCKKKVLAKFIKFLTFKLSIIKVILILRNCLFNLFKF